MPPGPTLMQMSTDLAFGPVMHVHCYFYIRRCNVYLVTHFTVSDDLRISQLSIVHHLHDLSKNIQSCWIVPHVTKILQNFWLIIVITAYLTVLLKAIHMNMQHSLIQGLMLYEIQLAQNICDMKGKSTVDHSTVTRWFNKFHSGCKNFDDQARSGKT